MLQNERTSLIQNESQKTRRDSLSERPKSSLFLIAVLSTAFAYGCILTTLFLITLPIECDRIDQANGTPKSVALGLFVGIAGFTQLVSPLVGRLSDLFEPPNRLPIGQRMPYYVLGGVLGVFGLISQMIASNANLWLRYSFAFFFSMVGLNVQYAMMIALIPDQVPRDQTGAANGILAFLLVMGSLFGFLLFHTILWESIAYMYGLYSTIVVVSTLFTTTYASVGDAELTARRCEARSMDESNRSQSLEPTPRLHKVVRKAKQIVLTPAVVTKSMFFDPVTQMESILSSYTIDRTKHHDFFVVTLSRLGYYCGLSVQSFFLYFVQDVLHVHDNPEGVVATLAILTQCSGALTCYPIGLLSDRLGRRRKPFVYFACVLLSSATLSLSFVRSLNQMAVFCGILGAANGVYLTMETSLAVDTLPDELETGSAQLLGVWGVAAFLGSALGPMIGGPILYLFQSDTAEESSYRLPGYVIVLSLSALYFALSAVALRFTKQH